MHAVLWMPDNVTIGCLWSGTIHVILHSEQVVSILSCKNKLYISVYVLQYCMK